MCWTDKISTENIIKLRDEFNIKLFVETGTWIGINVELYSNHFKHVLSCDIDNEFYKMACDRLKFKTNVELVLMSSDLLISNLRYNKPIIFFLDAHDFHGHAPEWILEKELKAINKRDNAVIVIHDYDNGELGFIQDGDRKLGWDMINGLLKDINCDFHYYTNTRAMCDIVNVKTVFDLPITVDNAVMDCIIHSIEGSGDFSRYRGMLYAVPKALDLGKYKLIEYVNK